MKKETERLPLILKNPTSAGSKDVHKAQTYLQYGNAINEIRRNYPKDIILAEEYLEGTQYLIETLTVNNKTNIIAIIEQKITFTGRFIVTGYKMILEHENKFYHSLKEAVRFIINKHGMKEGPCHLEIRHVKNEWKLIEINPRISGGAMNSFIETAYGINLVKETLKLAVGNKTDLEYKYKKETFLQYLIVPKEGILIKVTGRNKALACRGIESVYIKPKKESIIIPPISMAYRYAYVIATGKTAHDAEENAKYGASQIKFHLREIDSNMFSKLGISEKRLLNAADKNKMYSKEIDVFFNNFIMYN
jgi:biotin carboxylase